MPEPVTIIIAGAALYAWMKRPSNTVVSNPPLNALAAEPAALTAANQPVSVAGAGTGPDAPLATQTSIANQGVAPINSVMVASVVLDPAQEIPADLVAALDNDTALAMRAYAALNPGDFQAFLDKYAARLQMRNDMYLEAIENPPEQGYELTPAMAASLGNATYKVAQALNGVYVGRSVDLFGVSATIAGQIPSINPDLVSGLQAAAMGYRAITSLSQIMNLASVNNVSVLNFTAMTAAGAYPGLANLATFSQALGPVLMAVGLVVDIAFTILGDKPDLQKAIDVALDVASLAVLFIPVIGIVIAIVIQLVKFIIDLFGEDLFGGGMTHEQREVLETARYGTNLNPIFSQLADSYTPRELFNTIIQWGSGYCGGVHIVAMSINLIVRAGDTMMIGGRSYTAPADTLLGLGHQPCYWLGSTDFETMTDDEQAWALAVYAPVNGIFAMAQAGIADWRKEQFNDPVELLIKARATPMRDMIVKYKLNLNQIDQIGLEYRAQPGLAALAAAWGWENWQTMFAFIVAPEWEAFTNTITHGSLADFCRVHGYPTMYAFRAYALSGYQSYYARVQSAGALLYQHALDAQQAILEATMYAAQVSSQGGGNGM